MTRAWTMPRALVMNGITEAREQTRAVQYTMWGPSLPNDPRYSTFGQERERAFKICSFPEVKKNPPGSWSGGPSGYTPPGIDHPALAISAPRFAISQSTLFWLPALSKQTAKPSPQGTPMNPRALLWRSSRRWASSARSPACVVGGVPVPRRRSGRGVPLSAGRPLYGLRWGVSRLRVPAVLARPSHQLGVIVKQFTFENCEQT